MDTNLENFICREKVEESKDTFSKALGGCEPNSEVIVKILF